MNKSAIVTFLVRLAIFCAVIFVVDRLLGLAFEKVYFNQKIGQFSETTYAIDSAKQDILIFGSSRAARHFSSSIISKGVGLSCFNAGRDGMMIPYATAVQQIALERHKPKLIILDIGPNQLGVQPSKYEKLSILLPYYENHYDLVRYIEEISRFEQFKLYSKTYPFNSSLFILATNILLPGTVKMHDNGYLPRDGSITQTEMNHFVTKMTIKAKKDAANPDVVDARAVRYFKDFLDNSAKDNIKTLVVIPPTLIKESYRLDNQLKERDIIVNLSKKYPNVKLVDYSADDRFNYQPQKYSDPSHLNRLGAEEFSAIITRYIQQNYKFN
ncbi:DUF1574 family protein [Mucilaginibacter sp.]|uniref:DUF1574 family protein n=1 Tax=Mucilaginibacter sp. TaxID=1882438 RepID=UPI0035BC51B7